MQSRVIEIDEVEQRVCGNDCEEAYVRSTIEPVRCEKQEEVGDEGVVNGVEKRGVVCRNNLKTVRHHSLLSLFAGD